MNYWCWFSCWQVGTDPDDVSHREEAITTITYCLLGWWMRVLFFIGLFFSHFASISTWMNSFVVSLSKPCSYYVGINYMNFVSPVLGYLRISCTPNLCLVLSFIHVLWTALSPLGLSTWRIRMWKTPTRGWRSIAFLMVLESLHGSLAFGSLCNSTQPGAPNCLI